MANIHKLAHLFVRKYEELADPTVPLKHGHQLVAIKAALTYVLKAYDEEKDATTYFAPVTLEEEKTVTGIIATATDST